MKKKLIFSIISLFLFMGAFSQELANFRGLEVIVSPEIKDNTVTFRISAPYADSVQLSAAFLPTKKMQTSFGAMDVPINQNLTKNEKGVWSITLPLPEPELYTYSFIVDGKSWVPDPGAEVFQDDGFGSRNAVLRVDI